jgi:uncharacterized protein YdaU (DUF1376 family)
MAREKSPAFQFYADSWLSAKDILLMTPAEEGAYIRLLAIEWLEPDCGLPDNDDELAVLSRLGTSWEGRSRERVRAKFRAENGRLYNERLLEERRKQAEWSRKSSAGGRRAAEARARKSLPIQRDLELDARPTPPPAAAPSPPLDSRLIEAFHKWVAEYPNPVRVDTALQSWISLMSLGEITEATLPGVFAGLRRWKKSRAWAEDEGKYIPAPNVFLTGNERHKGRLWKDQPPESTEAKVAERSAQRSPDGTDPNAEWIPPWEEAGT